MHGQGSVVKLFDLSPLSISSREELESQVLRSLERMMDGDAIRAGDQLPSERAAARELKVSRNLVTAAYNRLEERGLIRRLHGKGAFRCQPQNEGDAFSWSGKISSRAHLLDEPVLELLARARSKPTPYSFSVGTPSMECFPLQLYRETVDRVISKSCPAALTVAPTEGQDELRQSIGQWLNVEPRRVMVTSGAQQGIDLLARCLIEPGDYAIVESPTYPGAIQCFRAAGARLIAWKTGWCLDELEQLLLRYRPKLLFITPTFQNPTGKVMPLTVRLELLNLAHRYHLPVLEDAVYSESYVDGCPPPKSLRELDRRSQVIQLSTFSKILAPGLRVGWIVAPSYMVKQLSSIKMRTNLFTGGLNQFVLADMLDTGHFQDHLEQVRRYHGILLEQMVSALQPPVQDGLISFAVPRGGLYLWCRLQPGSDVDELLETAENRGVNFAPGRAFFPEKPSPQYFRLCFTAVSQRMLSRGARALTELLRAAVHSRAV